MPKVTIASNPQRTPPATRAARPEARDPAHLSEVGGGPDDAQENEGEHGKLPGAEEVVQEEHGEHRTNGPIGCGDRAHDSQRPLHQSSIQRVIANRCHDPSEQPQARALGKGRRGERKPGVGEGTEQDERRRARDQRDEGRHECPLPARGEGRHRVG